MPDRKKPSWHALQYKRHPSYCKRKNIPRVRPRNSAG
nr:MAG TPA: hypothetical protein [Caudoviricetes sp.]